MLRYLEIGRRESPSGKLLLPSKREIQQYRTDALKK
jgi:hypothetical protein